MLIALLLRRVSLISSLLHVSLLVLLPKLPLLPLLHLLSLPRGAVIHTSQSSCHLLFAGHGDDHQVEYILMDKVSQ